MSVHDANPGDIYVDEHGKLWRVVGTYNEPTVIVEEIEPPVSGVKERRHGGVSGLMWHGWQRIFRQSLPVKLEPTLFRKGAGAFL